MVRLVSSGGEAAAALARALPSLDCDPRHTGVHTYYTSGDAGIFSATAEKLLGHPLSGPVLATEPYPLI